MATWKFSKPWFYLYVSYVWVLLYPAVYRSLPSCSGWTYPKSNSLKAFHFRLHHIYYHQLLSLYLPTYIMCLYICVYVYKYFASLYRSSICLFIYLHFICVYVIFSQFFYEKIYSIHLHLTSMMKIACILDSLNLIRTCLWIHSCVAVNWLFASLWVHIPLTSETFFLSNFIVYIWWIFRLMINICELLYDMGFLCP